MLLCMQLVSVAYLTRVTTTLKVLTYFYQLAMPLPPEEDKRACVQVNAGILTCTDYIRLRKYERALKWGLVVLRRAKRFMLIFFVQEVSQSVNQDGRKDFSDYQQTSCLPSCFWCILNRYESGRAGGATSGLG